MVGMLFSVASSTAAEIPALVTEWYALNAKCRDTYISGVTDAWCNKRDALSKDLNKKGMCYGRPNEPGYLMDWHVCKY